MSYEDLQDVPRRNERTEFMHPAQMEALGRGTVGSDVPNPEPEYAPRWAWRQKMAGVLGPTPEPQPLPLGGQHYTGNGPLGGGQVAWQGDLKPIHSIRRLAPEIPTIDRVVGRTRQEVEERADLLSFKRYTLVEYLKVKLLDEDWHGVQDAGSDLRDIDAELIGLRWVLGE